MLGSNKIEEHVFLTYFDNIEKLRERISKRRQHCNERELMVVVGRELDDAAWAVTPGGVSILPCGEKLVESYIHDSQVFKLLKDVTDPRQMYNTVCAALNLYGLVTAHTASTMHILDDMLDFCESRFNNYENIVF